VTPEEAERYVLSRELFGMRFGLDRMRRLMTALGHPQRRFESIHVVGTNGKSSTTRMIAAILVAHGIRTGAYLSPHLVSYNERIRIDDADLEPGAFAAAVTRAARAAELVDRSLPPGERVTQFELLTAAAYSELAARGVEVAAIEAEMTAAVVEGAQLARELGRAELMVAALHEVSGWDPANGAVQEALARTLAATGPRSS